MEVIYNLLLFVLGLTALYYGAEFLVKGGCRLAEKAGVSSLVIGLTLVACATSAPELVVSVNAALAGNADISLGNIVGSNICNIALILGLCAVITPLTVKYQILRLDAPVMLGYLCDDCATHFEAVKGCLDAAGVPYVIDEHIVRGLD